MMGQKDEWILDLAALTTFIPLGNSFFNLENINGGIIYMCKAWPIERSEHCVLRKHIEVKFGTSN